MATRIPTNKTSKKIQVRAKTPTPKRVKSFQAKEPKIGFFRRVLRVLFHPALVIPALLLTVGAILTLGYFWMEFSDRIDRFLSNGQIYTRNAGIYAAPKTLKVGEGISSQGLIGYLKGANYVEKNAQADETRSRYSLENGNLIIDPGDDSAIDGKKNFPSVRVKFAKDGKSVASINELETNNNLNSVLLEPKLLSSVLGEDRERRKVVSFNDLPPNLVNAITVTEDRAFFEHWGVNIRGIARAFWRRIENEEDNSPIARQGGSSITSQLVKNLLLNSEKSLERKLKEAYMSVILETRLSKQEIFTLYCNQIYLGQQASYSINGVGEAANAYFGKDVTALTLPEAAFLAGIIRSPNRYNPYKNPNKATDRRNQVLDSMVEAEKITTQQAAEAKQTPLKLVQVAARDEFKDTPYFTEFAQQQISTIVADPEAIQHLKIYTTIDLDLQRKAHEILNNRLDKLDRYFPKREKGSLQGALVAIKPKTGEIVAMVGGRNFLENQFNRATDAQRQPGSVFKPFVYAAALNTAYDPMPRVITAATTFKDEAKTFTYGNETYQPNNYGDFFSNKELTLRDALMKSKNVITVDLAMDLNVGKVMNLAGKAGLPKVPKAYPSMALGTAEATPLQMATAYTTFANLGQKATPIAVSRITNGEGATVAAPVTQKNEVLRPDVAYIMDDIMKDVVNKGTAAELRAWGFANVEGKTAFAGKTGTSRDGWFAGFTPDIVCVVYVGFDDGSDLGMKGSDSAMPIWADFMRAALDLHPEWNGDWKMPDGIQKAEIDIRNGAVIREINPNEETKTPDKPNNNSNSNTPPTPEDDSLIPMPTPLPEKTPDVPPEFRRIELFINGTIPIKTANSFEDKPTLEEPEFPIEPETEPTPTLEDAPLKPDAKPTPKQTPETELQGTVILQICPLTGRIASPSCPNMNPKTFKIGSEPKQYCGEEFHRKQTQPTPKKTKTLENFP
jgi:penicillin-binding protein 1B